MNEQDMEGFPIIPPPPQFQDRQLFVLFQIVHLLFFYDFRPKVLHKFYISKICVCELELY